MAKCEAFATELGVEFVGGRVDVPKVARDFGLGLEEAGRNSRYEFFNKVAFSLDLDLILTAHTLDDRMETVFMNLARGSGLNGIIGMPEVRDNIVRPIINIRRSETRAYCQAESLWFHDDPANEDLNLTRVRVRKKLVPEFEALNSEAATHLAQTAELASEEDRFLNEMAAAGLERIEHFPNPSLAFISADCEVTLDREGFLGLPGVLGRRGLQLIFKTLGSPSAGNVGSLYDQIRLMNKGSWTSSTGSVVLAWTDQHLHFETTLPDSPFRFPLTLPGETISEVFGWQIVAQDAKGEDFRRPPRSLDVIFDGRKAQGELFFRAAQTADRIQPLGMTGTKLLSDLFTEIKLSEAGRRRLPIICDMVGPLWVPGGALAERVRVDDSGIRPIRLTFEPLSSRDGS